MTAFLQGVQALAIETTDTGTGPSTVIAQSGEAARQVKWYRDSWSHLQMARPDWKWMRHPATLNTTANVGSYSSGSWTDSITGNPITRFASWYQPCFKAYLQSAGVGTEYPLGWMEWDYFRRRYLYGAQTPGQPIFVSVDPQLNVRFGPVPNDIYVVSGDYQMGPQILAADTDVPEMPARFHDLIAYEAMSRYGAAKVSPEVLTRAISEGGALRAALELDQLPAMEYGAALA